MLRALCEVPCGSPPKWKHSEPLTQSPWLPVRFISSFGETTRSHREQVLDCREDKGQFMMSTSVKLPKLLITWEQTLHRFVTCSDLHEWLCAQLPHQFQTLMIFIQKIANFSNHSDVLMFLSPAILLVVIYLLSPILKPLVPAKKVNSLVPLHKFL